MKSIFLACAFLGILLMAGKGSFAQPVGMSCEEFLTLFRSRIVSALRSEYISADSRGEVIEAWQKKMRGELLPGTCRLKLDNCIRALDEYFEGYFEGETEFPEGERRIDRACY